MKRIAWIISASFLLSLSACTSQSAGSIVSRWKFIDETGRHHDDFQQSVKTHNPEYEYTADGKFNAYMDGAIVGSSTYTMASDGKSMLMVDPQKGQVSFQILELSNSRLVITSSQLPGDTMIFERK